jgi:cystathionine beta-lyase
MDSDVPDWDLDDETLRRAGSAKWTYPAAGVLPAWVAEMDVRPSRVVVAAIQDAVDRGAFGYPPPDAVTGLPEAVAGFVDRRFGLRIDPQRVISCGDVMAGIRFVLETLCDPGPVVVPVPSYPPFLQIAQLSGRAMVTVPCRGRELDVEAIGAALADGARAVLLAAPHNPLGRAFTEAELTALRDVVLARGARVISDEIHAPLLLGDARHVPYASIEGTEDHVTTMVAASKAWNLPGLKCAQLVAGNAADLAALRAAPLVANHGTSTIGLVASVAAYTDGEPWLDAVREHLLAQRELFGSLLVQRLPQITWTPMEATYLAWVDARATGLPDPAAAAERVGKVMLSPGKMFGEGYEGFARVNLATSAERLHRIVDGLVTAWGG